jgi:hypothetical protein
MARQINTHIIEGGWKKGYKTVKTTCIVLEAMYTQHWLSAWITPSFPCIEMINFYTAFV